MKNLLNSFFIFIGFFSLILGIIGITLPVLPSTPFFILSYICFFKGSDKFHCWFIKTTFYKKYVNDFIKQKGLTLKRKISILLIADTLIIFSIFIVQNIYMTITLTIIIIFKFWFFLFKIKTLPESATKKIKD